MRPIDADELIKNIPNEEMISKYAVAHAPTIDKFEIAKEALIEAIDNAETVGDVVENIIGRPQGEWIDVTDELPKQGQDVLAWVETKDDARIACCNYSNSVWFDAIMDVIVSPIAWMPLPMPYHKDERSRR